MTIIFSGIIFLFIVYILSKDDFLFMRRNISLKTIFDMTILSSIVGVFFSRLVFISMHPSTAYFNPLVFLVIPYFPGLSAAGFIFGFFLALYLFIVRKKLPIGKLYDIFSLALICSAGFLFLGFAIEQIIAKHVSPAIIFGVCFLILLILYNFLRKLSLGGSLRDGSIAIAAVAAVCIVSLTSQAALLSFTSLPKEFPYFLVIFAFLLVSFFVKLVKKTGDRS